MRSRYPLAILAGLCWAASFPKLSLAGLAWVTPALMIAAATGKKAGESFRIGYVAGLTHYLASLYWLLLIPYRWHSIPLGPAAGWLALGTYLALYPATWVWLISRFPPETWTGRRLWEISGAAAWVGLEMILARLFSGFPWDVLGVSQYQLLPLIQIASFTGVYGVSFLVVWVSLSLFSAAVMLIKKPTLRYIWMGEIVVAFFVVVLVVSFGFHQLGNDPATIHQISDLSVGEKPRSLSVTFVQPSIPQAVIWDQDKSGERFQDLLRLSEQALTNETDLLLWPESAVPRPLRYFDEMFGPITSLAREHHAWMIVGSDDLEQRPGTARPEDREYYNSSFLISPEGKLMSSYRKRGLVIFGEYIPFEHSLPFFKWFTPSEGSFTPGERAVPFMLDRKAKTSVLICFEDVFPHLAREYAEDDTDFLVNLTNNGWFGESAAQWQHACSALFRAIENGLPLVRCSNNGLTCWVDERGRLRQIFYDKKGAVYGPGFMTAEIPLLPSGEKRARTVYNQYGDWFGWIGVGITAGLLVTRLVRWKKSRFRNSASQTG